MKAESLEIIDFEMRRFRKESVKMRRAADELGFVGITQNGQRVSYMVSAKLWRTGVLDSDAITKITNRGKIVVYIVPTVFWEMGMSFLGAFTPAGRRKLPGLARAQAGRDARESKRLGRNVKPFKA